MRVLYDYQIFEQQQIGGVSRYFAEISSHLKEFVPVFGIKYSNNVYLNDKNLLSLMPIIDYRKAFIKNIEFKGKGRLFQLYKYLNPGAYPDFHSENRKYSEDLIDGQDFDVIHITNYSLYFLEHLNKKPFVITVHDLIHEMLPEFFSADNTAIFAKKRLIEEAAHIIAVSENTKQDIINYYKINPGKITVIYHGSSNKIVKHYNLDKPAHNYLLFIGSRTGYKNFLFFIHSVAEFLLERDLDLVCTGEPFTNEEKVLFGKLGIFKRAKHVFADERKLQDLYNNALCLVFPSLYEGFGMPILEAFINECPVILSDTSCFREIAGDAAIYFAPKNKYEIIDAIDSLLVNKENRKIYIKRGLQKAESYSWTKAAEQTENIYKQIIKNTKAI